MNKPKRSAMSGEPSDCDCSLRSTLLVLSSCQSCSAGWHTRWQGPRTSTYNWATFFDQSFRQQALKGIKSMHHLTFTSTKRGCVIVKDSVDGLEKEIKLIQDDHWAPTADSLPPTIPPPGLSLERRQHLFEKIREFCPVEYQDLVCPDPAKENTPPLHLQLHLNLSNRGGTDLLPIYYFLYRSSLLYLYMLYMLFRKLFIGIYLPCLSLH